MVFQVFCLFLVLEQMIFLEEKSSIIVLGFLMWYMMFGNCLGLYLQFGRIRVMVLRLNFILMLLLNIMFWMFIWGFLVNLVLIFFSIFMSLYMVFLMLLIFFVLVIMSFFELNIRRVIFGLLKWQIIFGNFFGLYLEFGQIFMIFLRLRFVKRFIEVIIFLILSFILFMFIKVYIFEWWV